MTIDKNSYKTENGKDENENNKKFVTIDGSRHEVKIAEDESNKVSTISIITEGDKKTKEANKSSEVSYKKYL